MARRNRNSKKDSNSKKDAAETKKFFTVVGVMTLALIVLVYLAMEHC